MISTTLPASRFWLASRWACSPASPTTSAAFCWSSARLGRALRYFVALGAGFMLAAALLEMLPKPSA